MRVIKIALAHFPGLVKVTVFLRNSEDFKAMNEVYVGNFPTDPL